MTEDKNQQRTQAPMCEGHRPVQGESTRRRAAPLQLSAIALVLTALFAAAPAPAFAQSPAGATPTGAKPVKSVEYDDTMPAALQARLNEFSQRLSGQPVTQAQVQAMVASLTEELRAAGYPLSLVVLTPDNWSRFAGDGVLRLRVFEGDVGRITIGTNNSPVADSRIVAMVQRGLCGRGEVPCVITSGGLERATLLLSDLPGVSVKPFNFSPQGVAVGQTALVVDVDERDQRITAAASVDNYGVGSTGANRLGVSVQASNLLHMGESISLGAQTTNKHQNTGTVGISVPVLYDGLRVQASAARTTYPLESVNAQGTATSAQVGVSYPLTRAFDANWLLAADGYDIVSKETVAGQAAFPPRHLNGVHASISGNSGDRTLDLSQNYWAAGVTLTSGNASQALTSPDTTDTLGHYGKFALNVAGRQVLGRDWFVLSRLSGQLSTTNLDGSESMSVGGINGLRAYSASEGSVTEGLQMNVELRHAFRFEDGSSLVPGVFVDYLNGWILHTPYAGWQTALGYSNANQSNHRALSDVGFGLDWAAQKGLTAGLNIAWKTPWSEASTNSGKTSARVLFTVGMRY